MAAIGKSALFSLADGPNTFLGTGCIVVVRFGQWLDPESRLILPGLYDLGQTPDGLPYSVWQLVEHIRLSQWDILDFCKNPHYKSMNWPDDYWPKEKAPAHKGDFKKSVDRVLSDRKAFIELLHKAGDDELYTPLKHGDGQNLFREALLIIDHTSYHIGELIVLRRLLGDWK